MINAPNSGPYTTINSGFSPTGVVGTGCSGGGTEVIYYPLCIDIEAQTKGVHGVTCIGPPLGATGPYPHTAGIYVNASNNTFVEDLHFERYWDGVEIGNVPCSLRCHRRGCVECQRRRRPLPAADRKHSSYLWLYKFQQRQRGRVYVVRNRGRCFGASKHVCRFFLALAGSNERVQDDVTRHIHTGDFNADHRHVCVGRTN